MTNKSGQHPSGVPDAAARSLKFRALGLFNSWWLVAVVLMVRVYWLHHDHDLGLRLTGAWLVADGIACVVLFRLTARKVRKQF